MTSSELLKYRTGFSIHQSCESHLAGPGAKLGEAVQVRLAAVDERLATLSTALWQNVLAPARDPALVLEANEELAGLPTSLIVAMSAATQTITW